MNRSLPIILYTLVGASCLAQEPLNWPVPPGTAIPVEFTQTLNSAKARAGDPVKARTMQVVHLPNGNDLPKGSLVEGEIVTAQAKKGDDGVSILSFRFERVITRSGVLALRLYVRALTDNLDSADARFPTPPSDANTNNTRTLIGGDQVTPVDRKVHSSDDDVVGDNLKEGVVERLVARQAADRYSQFSCDGTTTKQSVAIYSGSACGLYGLGDASLAHTGKNNHGIIELDSRHYTLKLYAWSSALLQVAPPEDQAKP